MKKIGILTFHNACNYGAFLQTKALSEFINEQCEREVYIVDLICIRKIHLNW